MAGEGEEAWMMQKQDVGGCRWCFEIVAISLACRLPPYYDAGGGSLLSSEVSYCVLDSMKYSYGEVERQRAEQLRSIKFGSLAMRPNSKHHLRCNLAWMAKRSFFKIPCRRTGICLKLIARVSGDQWPALVRLQ